MVSHCHALPSCQLSATSPPLPSPPLLRHCHSPFPFSATAILHQQGADFLKWIPECPLAIPAARLCLPFTQQAFPAMGRAIAPMPYLSALSLEILEFSVSLMGCPPTSGHLYPLSAPLWAQCAPPAQLFLNPHTEHRWQSCGILGCFR